MGLMTDGHGRRHSPVYRHSFEFLSGVSAFHLFQWRHPSWQRGVIVSARKFFCPQEGLKEASDCSRSDKIDKMINFALITWESECGAFWCLSTKDGILPNNLHDASQHVFIACIFVACILETNNPSSDWCVFLKIAMLHVLRKQGGTAIFEPMSFNFSEFFLIHM